MKEQQVKYCVIVAGGSGLRMGSETPKQFIEINGKPVLMHTIERFYRYDTEMRLIVALPIDQQKLWSDLCAKHSFIIAHKVANGGITRFHSVKNALAEVRGEGLVAVHDGVRPLVSQETISRCFDAAKLYGAAIPVIPLSDSVREVADESSVAMNRTKLRLVQTPQTFQISILQKAYQVAYRPEFTDDASVVENIGQAITLVEGNTENIKLTYPSDIAIAKALLL